VKDSDSLPGRSFEGAVTFLLANASNVLRSAKRCLLRQYQLNHKKYPSQPHLYSYTQGRRFPGQLLVRSKQVNQQQKVHEVKSEVLSTTTNEDVPAFKSVNNIDAIGVYGTRDGKFERLLLEPVVNLQVCVCVNRRSPVSRHFLITSSHRPRPRLSTGTTKAGVERLPPRATFHLLEIITGE
jgi:hypothetical protein